ncbi:MAG: hypothetical protein ACYCYO_09330 [Bacilli bacterium]
MSLFWPTLPFYIPYSPGMPNWWDLVWWIFELVIMSLLLVTLTVVATRVDRDFPPDE